MGGVCSADNNLSPKPKNLKLRARKKEEKDKEKEKKKEKEKEKGQLINDDGDKNGDGNEDEVKVEEASEALAEHVKDMIRDILPYGAAIDIIVDYLYLCSKPRVALLMYKKLCQPIITLDLRAFEHEGAIQDYLFSVIAQSYPMLETLVLGGGAMSQMGIRTLCEGCPHLKRVSTFSYRVQGIHLCEFQQLKELTDLLISCASLTSQDLVTLLKGLPTLIHVELASLVNLDDDVLLALGEYLPLLQNLVIHDARRVTLRAVVKLLRMHPSMVFWVSGVGLEMLTDKKRKDNGAGKKVIKEEVEGKDYTSEDVVFAKSKMAYITKRFHYGKHSVEFKTSQQVSTSVGRNARNKLQS